MAKWFVQIGENYGPEANCVGLSCHHKPLAVTASLLWSREIVFYLTWNEQIGGIIPSDIE